MANSNEKKFLIEPVATPPTPLPSSTTITTTMANYSELYDENSINNMKMIQSPYYLCTVTCCDSENCIDHPTLTTTNSTIHNNKLNSMNKFNHLYEACQSPNNKSHSGKKTKKPIPPPNSPLSSLDTSLVLTNNNNNNNSYVDSCELCIQDKHKNSRILWADSIIGGESFSKVNHNINSNTNNVINNHCIDLSPIKITNDETILPNTANNATITSNNSNIFGRNNNKLKLKSLVNHTDLIQSPEMSSSPIGNNSSNTEFTEIFTPTPMCNSANSNNLDSSLIIQPLFKINSIDRHHNSGPHTPNALDYRLYFMNDAEKHGFFRKAVPTLPLAIAVMFCIMNLILPGSGTFLASIAIIFGSKTEYGPGCGYQAFLICFLSSILQFCTAIFVFGWVWSIMWGIVFIKNSLRYGHERDIHTISLC